MTVISITSGAHWRNVDIPTDQPRQFAHIFDPESPEDVPHEAQNFITYATALGDYVGPVVLYRPDGEDLPDWVAPIEDDSARHFGPDDDHVEVMMQDWKELVESALGKKVEIR